MPSAESLSRRVLLLRAVASLVVTAAIVVPALMAVPPSRPNILFLVIDTLRADGLGCYGGTIATPHIDALASAGTRHDPAVGSFHQTSASMGAMFTGREPSLEDRDTVLPWNGRTWCGMYRFGTGDKDSECLPTRFATLGEELKAAGYRTIGVTSNNLLFRPAGFDRGFDSWTEIGTHTPKDKAMPLADWARAGAKSRGATNVLAAVDKALSPLPSGPTFLYVHLMDVHDWWTPGDPTRNAKRVQLYGPAVARTDAAVGQLLEMLEARRFLRNATIVLVADHGESLREPHPVESRQTHEGNPTYETVARVPLIVVPSRGVRIAPELDGAPLLRTQDIYRIVLSAAGARDALPPALFDRDEVFYTELAYRTLRKGKWKISCERVGSRRCVLFDLIADPREQNDLAPAEPAVVAELSARMQELADRLTPDAGGPAEAGLSESDQQRLRTLGYLE